MVILSSLAKKNQNLKFEFEEKKFSLFLKLAFSRQKRLQTSLFSNKLNDHNRLIYKFENDQKNVGCVGKCASFC